MGFGLKKFAARTAKYTFDTLSTDPENPIALEVCFAGEGNAQYTSAQLKMQADSRIIRGERERREYLAKLFAAGGVVLNWWNVVEDGKAAPCEAAVVERFLMELTAPPPVGYGRELDAFAAFCMNQNNFRDPVQDPVELGKG